MPASRVSDVPPRVMSQTMGIDKRIRIAVMMLGGLKFSASVCVAGLDILLSSPDGYFNQYITGGGISYLTSMAQFYHTTGLYPSRNPYLQSLSLSS
jgi:hypothetical protein